MYGAEPRFNDHRYNDIPGLSMGISLTERKIFPVITIKSISQTTWNANIVHNKTIFYYIYGNNCHQCVCFLKNTLDVALVIYFIIFRNLLGNVQ